MNMVKGYEEGFKVKADIAHTKIAVVVLKIY
jgi:hypothetical protein